jgi:predicted nucleic acid-binding protein
VSFKEIGRGHTIGLDANIFLYVVTKHKKYEENCKNLLRRISEDEIRGVTSVIILDEVIYKIMIFEVMEKHRIGWKNAVAMIKNKPEAIKDLKKQKRVLDDIIAIGIKIKPLDLDLIISAEEICRKYLLMPHDAILVATLKRHGIKDIATNDSDFEKVKGIKVWKP